MKRSNCCNAPITPPGWPESDFCSDCKEHCDVYEDTEEEEEMKNYKLIISELLAPSNELDKFGRKKPTEVPIFQIHFDENGIGWRHPLSPEKTISGTVQFSGAPIKPAPQGE